MKPPQLIMNTIPTRIDETAPVLIINSTPTRIDKTAPADHEQYAYTYR